MPLIRLPALMRHYTGGENDFLVEGSTAMEAIRAAVDRFPALKPHVFDGQSKLRRHINVFVNDANVRDLDGPDTRVARTDVVRILPAISGGASSQLTP